MGFDACILEMKAKVTVSWCQGLSGRHGETFHVFFGVYTVYTWWVASHSACE